MDKKKERVEEPVCWQMLFDSSSLKIWESKGLSYMIIVSEWKNNQGWHTRILQGEVQ